MLKSNTTKDGQDNSFSELQIGHSEGQTHLHILLGGALVDLPNKDAGTIVNTSTWRLPRAHDASRPPRCTRRQMHASCEIPCPQGDLTHGQLDRLIATHKEGLDKVQSNSHPKVPLIKYVIPHAGTQALATRASPLNRY